MRYYDWLIAGVLAAVCVVVVALAWPLSLGMWSWLGAAIAALTVRFYAGIRGRREFGEHPPEEDLDKPWWKSRVWFWTDWKRRW